MHLFQPDILPDIIEADILNDFADTVVIRGRHAGGNPSADQLAQHAAELFMARIGKERTAVREHADKAAEHANIG